MKKKVIWMCLCLALGFAEVSSAYAESGTQEMPEEYMGIVSLAETDEEAIPEVSADVPETTEEPEEAVSEILPGETSEEDGELAQEEDHEAGATEEAEELPQNNAEKEEVSEEIAGEIAEDITGEAVEETAGEVELDDFLAEDELSLLVDDGDIAFFGILRMEVSEGWEERTVGGTKKYLYAKGTTDEFGNAEYYKKSDGIVTIEGKKYYFDENGYLVLGRADCEGQYVYAMEEEKAVYNTSTAVGDKTPLNSNLGQLQMNYWRWTGKAFEYYGEDGYFLSISKLTAKQQKAGSYLGYFTIDGRKFCLKDNGVPRTGDVTIETGKYPGLYYFYPKKDEKGYPGVMAVKTWVKITTSSGNRWRYYDATGRTTLGIKATKLDKNIDPQVGTKKYLLTNGGYIYQEAVMRKAADGYYYACNKKGEVQMGKIITYKGARYYMTKTGQRAEWTNSWHWLKLVGNRPYYFGSTPGKISEKKGWVKITDASGSYAWYYFSKKGNATTKGWLNGYYFDSKCALASGKKTIGGKTYIFRVSDENTHRGKVYKNTLVTYNGKKYYAGSTGALLKKQWKQIGDISYYFKSDGTMALDTYVKKDGVYGYVDSNGKFITGWVIVNASANKVQLINPDAPGLAKNTYKIVNGVRYYFDSEGYRVSDLTSYYPSNWKDDPVLVKIHNGSYSGKYYLECDKTNGVITVYTDSTKTIPVRTIRTSVGNPISLTPNGTYRLTRSERWQPLMGPSWGQYGTHVVNGIFIHSVACNEANCYNLPGSAYDMLGYPASHGCMRVCVADALWVYNNCSGSTIRIFEGAYQSLECNKGPLGRKPLVQRYGSGNFDPTDPAV